MELFARERQHQPRVMLNDLITLYTLHYGLTRQDAVKEIRKQAQEISNALTKMESVGFTHR